MKFQIGDRVSVLKENIHGVITNVDDNQVLISDSDGFDRTYEAEELVLDQPIDYGLDSDVTDAALAHKLKEVRISEREGGRQYSGKNHLDLHIEELVDDHRNMTNFEIVQTQMEACKSFVRKILETNIKKIYIIHGKGEGVLKSEVHQFLSKLRSENGIDLDFHDAPYHEFGMGGATEVIFL